MAVISETNSSHISPKGICQKSKATNIPTSISMLPLNTSCDKYELLELYEQPDLFKLF